jgi:CBS domain-containing protein
MKIKDVMRRDFVSVGCNEPLLPIAESLVRSSIPAAAVLYDENLVGIIAQSDLLPCDSGVYGPGRAMRILRNAVSGDDCEWTQWARARRARDVMKPPAAPVQEDDDPTEVGRLMLESDVRNVPVLRGTILVGILSRPELLRLLRSSDLTLERSIERLLWRCRFNPPEYNIDVDIKDGAVVIEGEVSRQSDVRVVGTLIAALDGVAEVRNLLSARSEHIRILA